MAKIHRSICNFCTILSMAADLDIDTGARLGLRFVSSSPSYCSCHAFFLHIPSDLSSS